MKSNSPRLLHALVVCAMVAAPVMAQQNADSHSSHHPAATRTAGSSAAEMADGEVRKIDKETGKVTLRHGEIKHLEMPPMTMVFQLKEAALLDKIKAGDKVRFRAEKAGGVYLVTAIEVAR